MLFGTVCVQVKRQQKNKICMYTKVNDDLPMILNLCFFPLILISLPKSIHFLFLSFFHWNRTMILSLIIISEFEVCHNGSVFSRSLCYYCGLSCEMHWRCLRKYTYWNPTYLVLGVYVSLGYQLSRVVYVFVLTLQWSKIWFIWWKTKLCKYLC